MISIDPKNDAYSINVGAFCMRNKLVSKIDGRILLESEIVALLVYEMNSSVKP